MRFPYIKLVQVKDCYAYQDLNITTEGGKVPFKHIILTGKNGSGKTTILNRIAGLLQVLADGQTIPEKISKLKGTIAANKTHVLYPSMVRELKELNDVTIEFAYSSFNNLANDEVITEELFLTQHTTDYIVSIFKAQRKVNVKEVTSVTTENEFLPGNSKISGEEYSKLFKQYLVNKKVYQAFELMDQNMSAASRSEDFFADFEQILREIFDDQVLSLIFHRESFEFYLKFSDNRQVTFNDLSAGFSAFLYILSDLIIKVDLIRKQKKLYDFHPCGFVVIDEPETHLHLAMQYQILPLLNRLFPNIQFIVATHSPAVISSLADAVVYDLTTKETASRQIVGSSFSELMTGHFRLENQFSPIADSIIEQIEKAYKEQNTNALNDILQQNAEYLTPSLRLEIESRIIFLETKE